MELDELKKSWNRLDKQLQREPMTDEKQIARLVERYKGATGQSLKRLQRFQWWSIYGGGTLMALLLVLGFTYAVGQEDPSQQLRNYIELAFLLLTILVAVGWDLHTYRWIKRIAIDELPVVEVIRRMRKLRRWTRYEIAGICIWTVAFNALTYWAYRWNLLHPTMQLCGGLLILLMEALFIYYIYKKMVYKPLDDMESNLDKLKDVCTE